MMTTTRLPSFLTADEQPELTGAKRGQHHADRLDEEGLTEYGSTSGAVRQVPAEHRSDDRPQVARTIKARPEILPDSHRQTKNQVRNRGTKQANNAMVARSIRPHSSGG